MGGIEKQKTFFSYSLSLVFKRASKIEAGARTDIPRFRRLAPTRCSTLFPFQRKPFSPSVSSIKQKAKMRPKKFQAATFLSCRSDRSVGKEKNIAPSKKLVERRRKKIWFHTAVPVKNKVSLDFVDLMTSLIFFSRTHTSLLFFSWFSPSLSMHYASRSLSVFFLVSCTYSVVVI